MVGARPAVPIRNANSRTQIRINTPGYHRPRSIGGPSTDTARSPITPPKMTRPTLSSIGM
jgi:hypothetical protein